MEERTRANMWRVLELGHGSKTERYYFIKEERSQRDKDCVSSTASDVHKRQELLHTGLPGLER